MLTLFLTFYFMKQEISRNVCYLPFLKSKVVIMSWAINAFELTLLYSTNFYEKRPLLM